MAKGKFVIVIGTSAGGTLALPELLKQLTDKMDVSVFIVMHLTKKSIGNLVVSRLQKHTIFTCKIATHNEPIVSKHIYIAMPDHHMMVKNNKILVGKGPLENRYRPSIDALFRSAAVAFGPKTIGIILTGMLEGLPLKKAAAFVSTAAGRGKVSRHACGCVKCFRSGL